MLSIASSGRRAISLFLHLGQSARRVDRMYMYLRNYTGQDGLIDNRGPAKRPGKAGKPWTSCLPIFAELVSAQENRLLCGN